MGFIKKAIVDIISAILTKKIEQGSLFRIQSRRENSTYCLLRYYGINVTSDTIYFTAISVSSDVNDSNAPIISVIDTGENTFTSKQLDQKRREQIQRIDADILNKASNFERGQDFKMDDKYRMAPHEKKEISESISIEKRVIRLNETRLRKIISEAIRSILRENAEGVQDYHSIIQKYNLQPSEEQEEFSEVAPSWVKRLLSKLGIMNFSSGYYLDIMFPEGWYHTKIYDIEEEEMFEISERIVNELQKTNWRQAILGDQERLDEESYTDICYIEGLYTRRGEIFTDTVGYYSIDNEDGYGFWG
jgi:hypothetical protein